MKIRLLFALLGLSALVAAVTAGDRAAADSPVKPFPVYDNMFFRGKLDATGDGLIISNILYEGSIWPHHKNEGKLQDRNAYRKLVRSHNKNPGPLVIDIELLPVKGPHAKANMEMLATLADWAREDAPGKIIGFYGTGTLTKVPTVDLPLARELAKHVDAFFPPMYTFDDDRAKWAQRAKQEVDEARDLGPGKPVYFYLWPQYHDNTPKQFQWVDSSYWKFQLDNARRDADGIVLWGSSKFDWDNSTGWWTATQKFMRSLQPPPGARY